MHIILKQSATSTILRTMLRHSTTGAGLTGLTSASGGLIISTIADVEATATTYTAGGSTIETITTLGTFAAPTATKCRFKEVDSANHPGLYELQFADARFAVSSAKRLRISLGGATNLLAKDITIQLIAADLEDSVRLGLTALPNVAAAANGGLPTIGVTIPNAPAGATGGLLIAGSNAATTFATLTVTGAFSNNGVTDVAQTGDSFARIGATGSGLTSLAPSATALSTANWTTARAGYLDNINVGGAVASQADINALNQSASRRVTLVTVPQFERPEAGSVTFQIEARTYDGDGAAVNADTTPTLTATGLITGSLAGNLSAASNPATGVYRWTYTVSSTDTLEQIRFDLSATIAASTFTLATFAQVADFVSATWTTTDSSNLTAIFNKLPSRGFLTGTSASTGALLAADLVLPAGGLVNVTAWSVNITGNLIGSVGSIGAGGITNGSFAANAIDAAALANDAVLEIQSGLSTLDAVGVRNAIGLATNNLDTQLADLPTNAELAASQATALTNIRAGITTDHGAGSYVSAGAGTGTYPITMTFVDTLAAPVPGASVRVRNGITENVLLTDINGQVTFQLDVANWDYGATKSGYVGVSGQGTVTGSQAGTLVNTVVMTASAAIIAPSNPALCRIYGDMIDGAGAQAAGYVVRIVLDSDVLVSAGAMIVGRVFEPVTNPAGHFEQDVVRTDAMTPAGLKWHVTCATLKLNKRISVETGTIDVRTA